MSQAEQGIVGTAMMEVRIVVGLSVMLRHGIRHTLTDQFVLRPSTILQFDTDQLF